MDPLFIASNATAPANSGKVKVNLKANWGVSSRAIPRYETMDEAGYLETIFQSYKNSQIVINGSAIGIFLKDRENRSH